jgi:lipoic acid synthetase
MAERVHLPVVEGPAAAEPAPRRRHPAWIRVPLPTKPTFFEVKQRVGELKLHTSAEAPAAPHRRVLEPPGADDHDHG